MRLVHHSVALSRSPTMSNSKGVLLPFRAGLSWKRAARFIMSDFLLTGVLGGASKGLTPLEPTTVFEFDCEVPFPRTSSDAGSVEACMPSSSGSTNSKRRSAALSACSARARRASSTIGWGMPAGGDAVDVDKAFEGPGRELLDLGDNDAACEFDFGTGGYNS